MSTLTVVLNGWPTKTLHDALVGGSLVALNPFTYTGLLDGDLTDVAGFFATIPDGSWGAVGAVAVFTDHRDLITILRAGNGAAFAPPRENPDA